MEDLSNKAKIVYAAFDMLNAKGKDNKTNAYTVLDFISENEDLQDHELLKEIDEQDFVDIIMELSIKGVNTLIASMCRKGIMAKTEPTSMKIEGQRRVLREYYIVEK